VTTGHVGITIEFHDAAGRQLAWKGRFPIDGWCTQKSFTIDKVHTSEELRSGTRRLAIDLTIELCRHFGVPAPPRDELEGVQRDLFDAANPRPPASASITSAAKAILTVETVLPPWDPTCAPVKYQWVARRSPT
jgi:hypothetical protein